MIVLRTVLRYVLAHKRLLALFLAGMLLEAAYTAFAPLSFKYLIDYAFLPKDVSVFWMILAALVGLGLVSSAAGVASDYSLAKIGELAVLALRKRLFGHMLEQSPSFFAKFDSGTLMTRLTSDVSTVDRTITTLLPATIRHSVTVAIGLGLLLQLEWRLTLAMLIGSALLFISPNLLRRRAEAYSNAYRTEQDRFIRTIDESLRGQRIIKGFHLYDRFLDKAKRQIESLFAAGLRTTVVFALMDRIPSSALMVLIGMMIGLGGYLIFADVWTVGAFIAYYTILLNVGQGVYALSHMVPSLLDARVSFERIQEVLDTDSRIAEPAKPAELRSMERLAFERVTFGYKSDSPVLKDVSFTIPAKGYTAFVGPSGSGKSTALQLLLRFYVADRGAVKWNEIDLREAREVDFRRRTGIVFQDSLLFEGTIRDNILLANPDADEEAMIRAAREARIHETIQRLSDGYDTRVEGYGDNLSGGQRQRVAIARALVRGPELLVLDEATSALDPATEAELNEAIAQYRGKTTVVSVTHRLSSVAGADHIVVFQHGEIAEQGTHEELMKGNGLYRAMWVKQQGFRLSEDGFLAKVDAARLRQLPIFAGIAGEHLEQIAPLFVTETYEQGQTIVREREEGDKLYMIARGVVEVVKEAGMPRPTRVAVLDDGDHFGEISLLRNIPRTATIVALAPSVLLSLRREQLFRLTARFPRLLEALEQKMNERL